MPVIHIDKQNFASEVLHSDIRVGKVNVDEQPELARQFGIMGIPALVVMKNGRIVSQAVGARPRSAIESMLQVG